MRFEQHRGFKGQNIMNFKKIAGMLPILAGLLLMEAANSAAVGAAPQAVRSVVDMAGRTVRLKSDIRRIVLIRGRDIYELSALLGEELPTKLTAIGSEIKTSDKDAYDKYCLRFPQLKRVPLINDGNGQSDLCGEQLVALKPDIVIADCFMRKYGAIAKFEKLGLPIFYIEESSDPLASPQKSLIALGNALGKQAKATQIVAYVNKRCQLIDSRLAKIKTLAPTVYLESGSSGAHAFGSAYPKKFAFGAILDHARTRNITANSIASMSPTSPEFVVKSNPDIIIITGANWPMPDTMRLGYFASFPDSQGRLKGFTARLGWSGLRAVKNKQVYSVFHGFAMHIFDFAAYEAIAKDCYPNQFKDIDPTADLKEFHQKFLPIPFSGIWMMRLQ